MNVSKESKGLNLNVEEKKEDEEEKSLLKDEEFEKFQNVLSKELVLELYSLFKLFEEKGLINYKIYIESMTEIFKKYNRDKDKDEYEKSFKEIFDLIFNRFQKIKCIMKNDKKVFFLTNMIPQNQIETYIIVCFLTIFIKCRIIDKIKLLFELTDVDDDGFLNKREIKQMISTINFMFSEENILINTNSSILAQSLMNIKVKEKINKIMFDPGNLSRELEKEKYIGFDVFYNSLIKIKNYKYEIIPCFINMKQCLYKKRTEKILEVKNKYKKEFVRASSALSSNNKPENPFKRFKRNFSANNLGRIIKNVKIGNDNSLKVLKKKQLLLGIKEKTKSFKDLLKESTIFSDEENEDEIVGESLEENGVSSASKRKSFYSTKDKPFYIFEADLAKIKKIEVQPALLKFSKNEKKNEKLKKKIGRYNSTLNGKQRNYSIYNRQKHSSTKDLNAKNDTIGKNSEVSKNVMSFKKRASILPMKIRNNLYNNFNFHRENSFGLYNNIFGGNNTSNVINYNNVRHNSKNILKDLKDLKDNSRNSNILNNINISSISKSNKKNNHKQDVKRPFSSIDTNASKKKSNIEEMKAKNNKTPKFNRFKYRRKNINKIFSWNKNKRKAEGKKVNKYLSANEIFKDVDKNEEKLRHERTEYFGKELIALYKKMMKEKKEIRAMVGKYDKYDVSLNFFDFRKKAFPKDYGKSIFSYNKYY